MNKVNSQIREFALNPNDPHNRGMGYRPDTFFQTSVAAQKFLDATPQHIIDAMK